MIRPKNTRSEICKLQTRRADERYQRTEFRKAYLKEKAEEDASQRGISNMIVRKILQEVDVVETSSCDMIVNECLQICDKVYALIKVGLGYNVRKKSDITLDEIKSELDKYVSVLKRVKVVSSDKSIQNHSNQKKYNIYEKLFKNLVELDARYLVFAPKIVIETFESKIFPQTEEFYSLLSVRKEKLAQNEKFDYVEEFNGKSCSLSNEMLVELLNKESLVSTKMICATEKLSEDLFKFIKVQLKLGERKKHSVLISELEDVKAQCYAQLHKLRSLSNQPLIYRNAGWGDLDPYTQLFNRLIEEDINFVQIAPEKSLNRSGIDFNLLTDLEKSLVFTKLVEKGIMSDSKFFEAYKEMFMKQIIMSGIDFNI